MTDQSFRGARCLVTGGAGFIGSNLTRALLAAGARVTVLDNLATGRREHLPAAEALDLVVDDLRTTERLPDLLGGADYVFHLAAQVGNVKSLLETEADAATNVLGTVRLLRACQGTAVRRVVYSSSSAIFGEAQRLPIDEEHPQAPTSFYALSKLTAEKYALLAAALWDVPVVCLRYFNVFGLPMEDNEYTGVIAIFLRRLVAGAPLVIYGDGSSLRDFVHVADVARANLLAAERGRAGRVYNIGSGTPTTVQQLADVMGAITGRRPGIEYRDFRPVEVRSSLADIARAQSELGYAPAYDLHRGLTEIYAALAASGSGS